VTWHDALRSDLSRALRFDLSLALRSDLSRALRFDLSLALRFDLSLALRLDLSRLLATTGASCRAYFPRQVRAGVSSTNDKCTLAGAGARGR
jgi:hypothetical protein